MNFIDRLANVISEIDILINMGVNNDNWRFIAWKKKVLILLRDCFGEDSLEYSNFVDISFAPSVIFRDDKEEQFIAECIKGLRISKSILEDYLCNFSAGMSLCNKVQENNVFDYSKIFIVHGHDRILLLEVVNLISKQGINPIILSEQTNKGKTIIEKIEQNSTVGAAICLFTPDDSGKSNNDEQYNNRARQNVVFETGYFYGRLGRDRTIFLMTDNLEIPSDLQGVVYSTKDHWKNRVLRELEQIGFTIDYSKLVDC